jgi:hypothetical protein
VGLSNGGIERIKAAGGVVAAPVHANAGTYPWVEGDPSTDFALMDEIVACAVQTVGIDSAHIHTAGFSAGGLFAAQLSFARASYIASVATYSGGAGGPSLAPDNHFAAMVVYGGPADTFDRAGLSPLNFAETSKTYHDALAAAGHFAFLCNHGGGHRIPCDLPPTVVQFFFDHPYMTPSPYAGGLPGTFPLYCGLEVAEDAGAPPPQGAGCNDVVNGAPEILATAASDPMPEGTGGVFADGTYFATKFEIYPGSPFPASWVTRETSVVSSGTSRTVFADGARTNFNLVTSGSAIVLEATCGCEAVQFSSYAATPTSFTLYHKDLRFAETYTKQ